MNNLGRVVNKDYWAEGVVAQLFSIKYDKWIDVRRKKGEEIEDAIIRVARDHGYDADVTMADLIASKAVAT